MTSLRTTSSRDNMTNYMPMVRAFLFVQCLDAQYQVELISGRASRFQVYASATGPAFIPAHTTTCRAEPSIWSASLVSNRNRCIPVWSVRRTRYSHDQPRWVFRYCQLREIT